MVRPGQWLRHQSSLGLGVPQAFENSVLHVWCHGGKNLQYAEEYRKFIPSHWFLAGSFEATVPFRW